jgi:hypothetical protein
VSVRLYVCTSVRISRRNIGACGQSMDVGIIAVQQGEGDCHGAENQRTVVR